MKTLHFTLLNIDRLATIADASAVDVAAAGDSLRDGETLTIEHTDGDRAEFMAEYVRTVQRRAMRKFKSAQRVAA